MQFQPSILLNRSPACSMILWMHADDAMLEAIEMHTCKFSTGLKKPKQTFGFIKRVDKG